MEITAEKIKSWLQLAGVLIVAGLAVATPIWTFVKESRANDTGHDDSFVAVIADVADVKADVAVVRLDVDSIVKLLREQGVAAQRKADANEAKRKQMAGLCVKDPDFAKKYEMDCYMAGVVE